MDLNEVTKEDNKPREDEAVLVWALNSLSLFFDNFIYF